MSECKSCHRDCGHGSDRLSAKAVEQAEIIINAHIEISRLKAELELQKETCKTGFLDRDAWKEKAMSYKTRVEKLEPELIACKKERNRLRLELEAEKLGCVSAQAWKAKAEKMAGAVQATHDYFSFLCQVYHGEKTTTGHPKVSSQPEIERLCNKAGLLCKAALEEFGR